MGGLVECLNGRCFYLDMVVFYFFVVGAREWRTLRRERSASDILTECLVGFAKNDAGLPLLLLD